MFTRDQVRSYHQQGYISVEGVYSEAEIQELRRVTEELIEEARTVTAHSEVYDLEPTHSAEEPRVRRIKMPSTVRPAYDTAMRKKEMLDIVSQLIGPDLRTNANKLNLKYPHYGSAVEWHQDWAFYPHTNDDLLAVGIAIDDMTVENGALLVIPGTHRGPVLDHHQRGVFVGAVTDPEFDPSAAVPVEVKAGGISIHHVRILHGSAVNRSDKARRLYLIQLCAADAFPLLGPGDWDEFNGWLLRGEPTNQPRLSDCPVRLPLPKSEKEGSIYEIQTDLENKIFAGTEASSSNV